MSRSSFALLSSCLMVAWLVPLQAQTAVISDQEIGKVWSGHPVTFVFLSERGHQFIAYYDAERRITIAVRKLGEEWIMVQPEGWPHPRAKRLTTVTEWDSHNYLALALDRDGNLHLSGNMHNDPLVYFRTERPFDIRSMVCLDRMTGLRENRVTYLVFFKNQEGDLLFRYRDGGSGNGADLYNRYDSVSKNWSRLLDVPLLDVPLLDDGGKRNVYAMSSMLGPDGRFHLVWMWRETPDAATNHTLSYARSRDFLNWEKSDGSPLALPMTLETAEVVDPVVMHGGLINMTFNLGFDAEKRPVITYHRYDSAGKSQIFAARPAVSSRRWDFHAISQWDFRWDFGGGGSLNADVTVGPPVLRPDQSLLVNFSTTHSPVDGRVHLSAETLKPLETLPALPTLLPPSLAKQETEGMEVQTLPFRDGGRLWVLRWETLPRNRDLARKQVPPPSKLRLIGLPDTEVSGALRIGS
ncbi:MAG: BNR repeat-containing protein [Luteolibacter sp.]